MPAQPHRPRALALLVATLFVGACGADAPPWQRLALSPGAAAASSSVELAVSDGVVRRLTTHAGEARLEVELPRAGWKFDDEDHLWRAQLYFRPLVTTGHELTAEGEHFTLAPGSARNHLEALAENAFVLQKAGLVLRLPAGHEPPARARLSCRLATPDPSTPGRLRGRRFTGEGLALWPGAPVERRCDIPAGSALSFALTLDPLVMGSASTLPALVFALELDGQRIFEHAEPDPTRASVSWHRVVLPAGGERGARLVFSVTGTPAYASILAPVVCPVALDAARASGSHRPDLVVFLADTFRADNMQLYGGTLGLTPNLDRFAQENLAFARTWSVGSFTLSAHASMFTGLYPHQAGVMGETHSIPEALETLAEFLTAHGYRTGAITDSGIVSQAFALDQGFAFFDEQKRKKLDETFEAARAFLDADDGRPVFLFVHTYRVHRPFKVSDETRREHGARLGIEGTFKGLEAELVALAQRSGYPKVTRAQDFPKELMENDEARALIAKLHAHYSGGVIDLDRGFEGFRAELAARGFFEHGVLAFTSDHGESFGEHHQLYHKDDVYEEQTRVPFVLAGRGIKAGVVQHAASLLDLAPTLAALAGLEPARQWLGRALVGLDEERVLYSFECDLTPSTSTFAVLDGGRKVMGLEERNALRAGKIVGAFDLTKDAHELANLAASESWPAEELARERATIERLLEPLYGLRDASLDPEKVDELEDLGYVGGNEEDR